MLRMSDARCCVVTLLTVKHIPSWFPGAQFKRDAEVWKSKMEAFVNEPYDFTKQQMVRRQATSASSVCRRVLMP